MNQPVYVAGLGCRKGCSMQELADLLQASLQDCGLEIRVLTGLATSEHKMSEPGLLALAEQLQLPMAALPGSQLHPYDGRLTQRSALSLQMTGSAGVAEASALAQAEILGCCRAELLRSRTASANATCAIAVARPD